MRDRPPWSARDQRQKNWMRDWVCDQLDDAICSQNAEANRNAPDAIEFEWIVKQDALEEAKTGDVIALRRLYPEIADYIHPDPKTRKPGRRKARGPNSSAVFLAKGLVPLIRDIGEKTTRGCAGVLRTALTLMKSPPIF